MNSRALYRLHYPLGIISLTFCISATSAPDDVWQPYVASTYTHYSNIFFVPNQIAPGTVGVADPVRADSSTQIEGGLTFNDTFGLQHVLLQAKFNKTYFEHYTIIDNSGKDLLANWDWNFNDVVKGKLGAEDVRKLALYTDFSAQQRNILDDRHEYGSANFMVSPHWRLHGGADRTELNYETNKVDDNTTKMTEAGIDFLAVSNRSIGVLARHVAGDYPNYQESGSGQRASNTYKQNEYKLNIDWAVTEKTELLFLGGRVNRTGNILPSLNIYGFNAHGDVIWKPTGSLKLDLSGWREYDPIQTGQVGYTIDSGLGVESTWDASSKLHLMTKVRYDKRDFYVFQSTGVVTPSYNDNTTSASFSVRYEPRHYIQLIAMLTHDLRSANVPYVAYTGNGASLNAVLNF